MTSIKGDSKMSLMRRAGLLLVCLVVALMTGSCGHKNDHGETEAPVFMRVDCVAPAQQMSDVFIPLDTRMSETLITNVPKRDGVTSPYGDINLEELRVTYRRTDRGSAVPGDLVVPTHGVIQVGEQVEFENVFPVVSTEQKEQPPLSDLNHFGVELDTGLSVISADAEMIFHARTEVGEDLLARATVPIRFCSSLFDPNCVSFVGECFN